MADLHGSGSDLYVAHTGNCSGIQAICLHTHIFEHDKHTKVPL